MFSLPILDLQLCKSQKLLLPAPTTKNGLWARGLLAVIAEAIKHYFWIYNLHIINLLFLSFYFIFWFSWLLFTESYSDTFSCGGGDFFAILLVICYRSVCFFFSTFFSTPTWGGRNHEALVVLILRFTRVGIGAAPLWVGRTCWLLTLCPPPDSDHTHPHFPCEGFLSRRREMSHGRLESTTF